MPTLSRIDYAKHTSNTDGNSWVIYADHANPVDDHYFASGKSFFCCDYSDCTYRDLVISSVFEKCNFDQSNFLFCKFETNAFFIDCYLQTAIFVNCIFKSEEQLIFLKMVGAKIDNCYVEGKDEPESWNV